MSSSLGPTTPDGILVRAVRRDGSDAAFSILYDRHTPRALQAAWRVLGGSQHDAEDALQEAWVRAVRSLDSWRGEGSFGAWLRGIAVHAALDILRKSARFDLDHEPTWSMDDGAGDRFDLESAIASLAPGYRTVLILHDIEGFTHEEIGERLGISAGTSKGQLFKARRAVRARLAPPTVGGRNAR